MINSTLSLLNSLLMAEMALAKKERDSHESLSLAKNMEISLFNVRLFKAITFFLIDSLKVY